MKSILWVSLLAALNGNKMVLASLEMPPWLKSLSGMDDWPSADAPYIRESFHDMSKVRPSIFRESGECGNNMIDGNDICSFDCDRCVSPNDIISCAQLSQSFDDGPSVNTLRLLDGLRKTNIKSTFFLIGTNVIEFPEIVRQENMERHELAVHTWSHKFLPSLSDEDVFAELQWCIWAINASTNVVPKYFRPPYGGLDNRIRDIATQLGLQVVLWDHDTHDWMVESGMRTKNEVYADIQELLESMPEKSTRKGLILEHDLTSESIDIALEISEQIGCNQLTISRCRGGFSDTQGQRLQGDTHLSMDIPNKKEGGRTSRIRKFFGLFSNWK